MEYGYKSLIVWQKSMALADEVRSVVRELPRSDEYELRNQMRRSSISIPSNIAEGGRRSTKKDYVQFLRIACGSAMELETQLVLAARWYPGIPTENASALITEIQKMLSTMIRRMS